MRPGYFITVEGVDGCGKSTAARLLCEHLRAAGRAVLLTYEPGASRLGEKLRHLLLTEANLQPEARAEALLFAADRAAHVREIILPALREGQIVLCDRYTDSTVAYQGGGRGLELDFLRQLNDFASFGLNPDLTFYLKVSQQVARQRQGQHQDRLEREDEDFFLRIADVYESLAAEEPQRIRIIDAGQSERQVLAAMLACLPQAINNAECGRPD